MAGGTKPTVADVDAAIGITAAAVHRFDLTNALLKVLLTWLGALGGKDALSPGDLAAGIADTLLGYGDAGTGAGVAIGAGLQLSGGTLVNTSQAGGGGLPDPGSSGFVVRTGQSATAARTLTGTARVSVTNPAGTAGNPVVDVVESGLNLANLGGVLDTASGGTGQATKTAAYNSLSPGTTKGDLIAFDGTNNVRLGAGADGLALLADSSNTLGVRYGSVNGAAVAESYVPTAYTPTGPTVEGNLVGLNAALASLQARVATLEGGAAPGATITLEDGATALTLEDGTTPLQIG